MTADSWTIRIPASVPLLGENRRARNTKADDARRAVLRRDAYLHFKAANIPALVRPRVEILIEFATGRRRDPANLHPTIGKPVLDALGPDRSHLRRVAGRTVPVKVNAPGVGVVADDSPGFLHCDDCPHLRVGVLNRVDRLRYAYGLITVTVTDLSPAREPQAA